MYILFLLIIPAVLAFIACRSNKYIFKALQTAACLLIVTLVGIYAKSEYFWFLSIAFFMSIIGDYFLSYNDKDKNYFVYGIALYFLAHISYMMYIIVSFKISLLVFMISFGVLLAVYLVYYFISLRKSITGIMKIAVLFYLIISCVVLALAISIEAMMLVKALLVLGILLIVISDTIIAEKDFMNHMRFEPLILPTYYGAQILLSASVIVLYLI